MSLKPVAVVFRVLALVAKVSEVELPPYDGWVERVVPLPAPTREKPDVKIVSVGPVDFIDYHLWIAQ